MLGQLEVAGAFEWVGELLERREPKGLARAGEAGEGVDAFNPGIPPQVADEEGEIISTHRHGRWSRTCYLIAGSEPWTAVHCSCLLATLFGKR